MEYPNALRRYIAALIDLAAAWTLLFAAVRIGLLFGSQEVGVALGIAAAFLYEPLTNVYACTLGQAVMRFRVRTVEGLHRITAGQACARFIVKYLLGALSFVTMPARIDRRAIHDLFAETIVTESAMQMQPG
jgi:uncharacterized RDD family membrane protein YckC